MPSVTRALEELVNPAMDVAQASRVASGMDINLFKNHPGIDASTAKMMTGKATKYMNGQVNRPKPSAAVAMFSKQDFEAHFGKVDSVDPDAQRKYFWQLKTGDGIEDLVIINAPNGIVSSIQGQAAAAAMWKLNPTAKVPVLVQSPGKDWDMNPTQAISWRGKVVPLNLPKYPPPKAPKQGPIYEYDEDGGVHRVFADPGRRDQGDVLAIDQGDGAVQVKLSFVPEAKQKQGLGTGMYERLAKQVFADGKRFISDVSVSPAAEALYSSLEKKGYGVIRNPAERNPETGNLVSADPRVPVFELLAKGAAKPVTTVPQAGDTSKMTRMEEGIYHDEESGKYFQVSDQGKVTEWQP